MTEIKPEEFPILCETCLGENPYLRMSMDRHGKACKICDRPFTVFRWKPGARARFKKTEVCRTCAKLKNVCQTCILDLQFGLPVQVRDKALSKMDKDNLMLTNMAVSHNNRNYLYEQLETQTGIGRQSDLLLAYNKITNNPNNPNTLMLKSLQRHKPYYKRNLSHICSFYVKGTCNRGDACPYRHEKPKDNDLSDQNIKDRFYGVNDPVAKKMLAKVNNNNSTNNGNNNHKNLPQAPTDLNIRTLWVGGISPMITEEHLAHKFSEFGKIESIHVLYEKKCAFVTFNNRTQCELVINTLFDCLYINGLKLKLDWGKSKNTNNNNTSNNNKNTTTNSSNNNTKNNNKLSSNINTKYSNEEEEYLKSQGLVRPVQPTKPDPVVTLPPPGMGLPTNHNIPISGYFNSMMPTYKENPIQQQNTNNNQNES